MLAYFLYKKEFALGKENMKRVEVSNNKTNRLCIRTREV